VPASTGCIGGGAAASSCGTDVDVPVAVAVAVGATVVVSVAAGGALAVDGSLGSCGAPVPLVARSPHPANTSNITNDIPKRISGCYAIARPSTKA
jgi:hypothetical protein